MRYNSDKNLEVDTRFYPVANVFVAERHNGPTRTNMQHNIIIYYDTHIIRIPTVIIIVTISYRRSIDNA